MDAETKSRIEDLEARLSFQEDLLATMNTRFMEQDNEIAKLQLQLQHLNRTLKDTASASEASSDKNERPPHY
jgi:SlyX protein